MGRSRPAARSWRRPCPGVGPALASARPWRRREPRPPDPEPRSPDREPPTAGPRTPLGLPHPRLRRAAYTL